MIGLEELLGMKAEFEKEKLFVEAKIAVVGEMIAKENAKVEEETPVADEVVGSEGEI